MMSSISEIRRRNDSNSRNHDGKVSRPSNKSKLLTSFNLIAQLADRDYFGALAETAEISGLDRNRTNGVCEAFNDSLVKQLRVRHLDACLFQRNEMAGQISAVHSRYVLGEQRLEGFRVVPIEEVAVKLS